MSDHFEPAYVSLLRSGELAERVRLASERLRVCTCCPRECGARRLESSEDAACRTGELAMVASYGPHMGEEDPLRGYRGSGTIFFSWCNMRCIYCQNYDISQLGSGRPTRPQALAAMMLELEVGGCHNINLVSPSHVVPQILKALLIAATAGLATPLVYNSGGYDGLKTLRLLDGVIDIYMPDMKYADPAVGRRLSGVPDYPTINQQAVAEMYRQVGDLTMDRRGIAQRGLLIRHLILPDGLAGTDEVVRFIAQEISTNSYLNLMDQYRPCHKAGDFPGLHRRITQEEYREAQEFAREAGIERIDRRRSRIL